MYKKNLNDFVFSKTVFITFERMPRINPEYFDWSSLGRFPRLLLFSIRKNKLEKILKNI